MIKRYFSILIRKIKHQSATKKLIRFVQDAQREISKMPSKEPNVKVLLLIRTDEIGDYLLCRNVLPIIRNSDKYKDYKIIYVGNKNYKDLAETLDKDFIDSFIWMEKSRFKKDASYRTQLFQQIRALAPSVVVALQRTTEVDYGDLIVAASNAPVRYANSNYYIEEILNRLSSQIYTNIYPQNWENTHEFYFNQEYANWLCETNVHIDKPTIEIGSLPSSPVVGDYILCVIGSSKKSKNWPIKNWVFLLEKLITQYEGCKIILFGGSNELSKAQVIQDSIKSSRIVSLVGKTSLLDALALINNAQLMISNDTFAIHARAALGNKPTVVMANGESAFRFSDLHHFSTNYAVLYAKYFTKKRPNMTGMEQWKYRVPSADMATIAPRDVLEKCLELYNGLV